MHVSSRRKQLARQDGNRRLTIRPTSAGGVAEANIASIRHVLHEDRLPSVVSSFHSYTLQTSQIAVLVIDAAPRLPPNHKDGACSAIARGGTSRVTWWLGVLRSVRVSEGGGALILGWRMTRAASSINAISHCSPTTALFTMHSTVRLVEQLTLHLQEDQCSNGGWPGCEPRTQARLEPLPGREPPLGSRLQLPST